jgi:large subunit ribosomal protein L5
MARLQQTYEKEIVAALTSKFGYTSRMQVPRLTKITLNMGLGEAVAKKRLLSMRLAT